MKLLILFLLLIPAVSADTTFFDNPDEAFIMDDLPPETSAPTSGSSRGGRPICNSTWVCEAWSECSDEIMERTCVDIKYCKDQKNPPLSMTCSEPMSLLTKIMNFIKKIIYALFFWD